jgi:hypothetical protein
VVIRIRVADQDSIKRQVRIRYSGRLGYYTSSQDKILR